MPTDEGSALFPVLIAEVPPPPVPPTVPAIPIQLAPSDLLPAPKPPRSALLPPSGQLLLGADKRNPLLTVYHDETNDLSRMALS